MRLSYEYRTRVNFSPSIGRHTILLRCLPADAPFQQIENEEFLLSEGFWQDEGRDGLGNRLITAGSEERHHTLEYAVKGEIESRTYCIPDDKPHPMYRQPSRLTQPSVEILSLIPTQLLMLQGDERTSSNYLETCLEIAHIVHRHIAYTPHVTNVDTTALEAFRLRQGVCQDYAHLMVALCRTAGFAARYVCGLMLGEGSTHAWVEVHDGQCWYAFDPTNDTAVASGYIKMAHGRDALDCPVSRGTFVGITEQKTEVNVRVERI